MGLFSPQLSFKQMSALCHQLRVAEEAGITVKRAFELLEEGAASRALRHSAENVASCIESGATLGQAIHWERKRFPEFFVALVQVGERTGTLNRVFAQLEKYYDDLWKAKLALQKSLAYFFTMLLCIRIGIPLLRYFLMGVATQGEWGPARDIFWIVYRGLYPFIVGIVLYAVIMRLPRLRKGFRTIGWYLWPFSMWTPSLALSAFYEALYLFQDTDIGFRRSLPAAGKTAGNPRLSLVLGPAIDAVGAGQSLAESLGLVSCIPKADISMLTVGEVSGSLAEILHKLSCAHYQTALFRIRNFLVVFSVLVIVILAFSI